MYVLLGI